MITAVHIEDEPRNIELLQSLLATHCQQVIEMKGFAKNVQDAFMLIEKVKPQLVFLDIELNRGNAFELLEKINAANKIDFEIIFITAFNEYAIKAFRLNAIDYLLKPISVTELKEAVNRAVAKIKNGEKTTDNINAILKQLNEQNTAKKIAISVAEGLQFVKIDEVIKLEAKGSYTVFHLLNNKKIICTKSIGDMEEILPQTIFVRVHNAWIVNVQMLKKYVKGRNGYLEMEDDSVVPVSVRKKGTVLDLM